MAYVIRRLLLIIPTLLAILIVNFLIVQAAPGGPVEQAIARIQAFSPNGVGGGGGEVAASG
ncbi:Peptide ABC transporter, permease protein, partial [Pseudomonas savastanoi pv. glycinea]